LTPTVAPPTRDEVLADVRRVLAYTECHRFPAGDWRQSTYLTPGMGHYALSTINALFGDWNGVLAIVYPRGIKERSHAVKVSDPGKPDKPVPAKITCLRCDRPFMSWDRRKNRLCARCHESIANNQIGDDVEPYEIVLPKSPRGVS
jgi:hypothetical protein